MNFKKYFSTLLCAGLLLAGTQSRCIEGEIKKLAIAVAGSVLCGLGGCFFSKLEKNIREDDKRIDQELEDKKALGGVGLRRHGKGIRTINFHPHAAWTCRLVKYALYVAALAIPIQTYRIESDK